MSDPIHILVVDDDPDILTILRDHLELDGYRIDTASSGRQALSLLDSRPFDLVVLDLMLPDMDGIQVCRSIRARSGIPVILLTAKDRVSDKVLGLESGADDYMVKPFDYLELEARIRARLRRSAAPVDQETLLEAGGIRLDPSRREAILEGRAVDLTKKQFDLLYLLARNADTAMTRESIRQALWPDKGIYRWSRAIDVHIQHVRTKIESNPEQPTRIVTVQGVGYMFNTRGNG
jgi:DNA-binding response OmpR family regulator